MYKLSFPEFKFRCKRINNQEYIRDDIRKKFVRLTPEEWVRQHVVHYLIEYKGFPPGLINLEVSMSLYGLQKRADIVCYNTLGQAILVVECKAPDVAVKQHVFEQISHYNILLKAPYLFITNGLNHYACCIDFESKAVCFLEQIPAFSDIQ